jgi:hypothetical protein
LRRQMDSIRKESARTRPPSSTTTGRRSTRRHARRRARAGRARALPLDKMPEGHASPR